MNVVVAYDQRNLDQVINALRHTPRQVPKVLRNGLNRTMGRSVAGKKTIAAMTANRLGQDVSMSKKVMGKAFRIRQATLSRHESSVTISSRRFRIVDLKAKQTKRGVTYRIKRKGRRQLIEGAFMATVTAGGSETSASHLGVFKRKSSAATATGRDSQGRMRRGRLPIVELRGPSLAQIVKNAPAILDEVQSQAGPMLEKNITDQVMRVLRSYYR